MSKKHGCDALLGREADKERGGGEGGGGGTLPLQRQRAEREDAKKRRTWRHEREAVMMHPEIRPATMAQSNMLRCRSCIRKQLRGERTNGGASATCGPFYMQMCVQEEGESARRRGHHGGLTCAHAK